jgi:pyruvate/2-oxoglutarate dehydrogenase complex dihydrolipoamide dehydrogenase (E3) component
MERYDIIAVGGGAAGLVTAAGAAGLGARVALIEQNRMGGECLWTGCVPSKALLAAARVAATARDGGRFGIDVAETRVNFERVMTHVRNAQQAIAPNDSPDRFRGLGVDVLQGTATFVDRSTLRVNNQSISARHIVIATGSQPAVPRIPGIDAVPYLTNENVFELTELPASLVVIGGGAGGVELAQAFALLGSKVTLIESDPRILRSEDEEVAELLATRLRRDGVVIQAAATVQSVATIGADVQVTTSLGTFTASALLIATGRKANTDALQLDAVGVAQDHNGVRVDKYLRTNVRNIWAIGDVVAGTPRFTHVADYQARLVLRNALFPGRSAADYASVPWAIYTQPELAHIGLTEAEARARYGEHVRVWRKPLSELDRAIADGLTEGLLKIVTDPKGKILGGHMLGAQASTVLGEIALAMKTGVPLGKLSGIMHAYPTYPEAIKHIGDAYVRSGFKGLARRAAGWLVRR